MKRFLQYSLFELGNYNIRVSSVLMLIAFIFLTTLLLRGIRRFIFNGTRIEVGKKYALFRLIKYFVMVFSTILALQMIGFNLSVLVAGSAALLVGLGLGLQNLFSDFISGIILLMDSSVKVDDVLEVNGLVCTVQEINLRTTTVLTRDDKYIILPNTDLTRNQLINWTHSDIASRFEIKVGVDYASDVNLVMKLLKEAAFVQEGVLNQPAPFIQFTDYGESSLNFSLFFWSEDVFRVENIKSNIRVKLYELFNAHNITIPFPQRVVHQV